MNKCHASVKKTNIEDENKNFSRFNLKPFSHLFRLLIRQSQNNLFEKFLNMETSNLVDKTSMIELHTHAKSQNIIEIINQRYKKTRNAKI